MHIRFITNHFTDCPDIHILLNWLKNKKQWNKKLNVCFIAGWDHLVQSCRGNSLYQNICAVAVRYLIYMGDVSDAKGDGINIKLVIIKG